MWAWLRQRRERRRNRQIEEQKLIAARKRLEDLERRANQVVPELYARRNRNHWGETIAAIARRDHLA